MEKEQFTPGEWVAERLHDLGEYRITNSHKTVIVAQIMERGKSWDTIHSNANLIAAAPDMYEALKEIKEMMQILIDNNIIRGNNDSLASMAIKKAEAALSKANPTQTQNI